MALRILRCMSLLVCISLLSRSAAAHHPAGGLGGAGGAIHTIPGTTFERGQWASSFQMTYTDADRFSDTELLDFAADDIHTHSVDYQLGAFLTVAHGATDDVTVWLQLPYFYMDDIREVHEGEDEVENEGDTAGIGDALGVVQFRLLRSQCDTLHISALVGLEVPTGRTDDETVEGERFELDHQPGSGSFDPLVGGALTKTFERVTFHASSTYQFNTEGAQQSELGDILTYDAAIIYRWLGDHGHSRSGGHDHSHSEHSHNHANSSHGHAHDDCPTLDLIVELNGIWEGEDRFGEEIDDNSGGNTIFVSPGFRLGLNEHCSFYFSGGIPVVQDLNGANHEVDYRLIGGTSVAW